MDKVQEFFDSRSVVIKQELGKAVKQTATLVTSEAKKRTPVDTGKLRASIKARTIGGNLEGEVATDMRYAIMVHENTRARYRTGEARFLKKASEQSKPRIKRFFEEAIKRVLET